MMSRFFEDSDISGSAVIDENAFIGRNGRIGHNVVIEGNVYIGDNSGKSKNREPCKHWHIV